jgi:2-polyprenyl-3-methyl-5-hydroxy-6-metoxy-1,4-benzoquinol methylase
MHMTQRPFYYDFAWAYEYIIDAPLSARCDFIAAVIRREHAQGGNRLLDAGCGPGQYSAALAQRGFAVVGLDASPVFIAQAQASYGDGSDALQFRQCTILQLQDVGPFDAILCRGVLNDFLDSAERRAVFGSFAAALHPGGVLLFDVREWHASVVRIEHQPEFVKTVETERGTLTFHSHTRLAPARHEMLVHEHHTHTNHDIIEASCDFTMRCWTHEEIISDLSAAGLRIVQSWGAYDAAVPPDTTDRIVICARLDA